MIMKKFFLSLLAVGMCLTSNAQTEKLMATLQHGDTTTVYYGENAFYNAYQDAADTLDIITLSGGEFTNIPGIQKSITIYGAGFEPASSQGGQMTYIGGLTILANGVHVEGICIGGGITIRHMTNLPIYNTEIVKCYAKDISFGTDSYNTTIRQSRVYNGVQGTQHKDNPNNYAQNLLISNCYLGGESVYGFSYHSVGHFTNESTIHVDHCLIKAKSSSQGPISVARYTNNITYHGFPDGSSADKNIFITGENPAYNEFAWWGTNEDFWAAEGEDGNYADEKTWELKNANNYIGTDGTQVGLHGGVYAWNKFITLPRITEYSVDTKDANNGFIKLTLKAEASNKE